MLVVQSVHARPPAWIERCLGSVRGWAEGAGHDYRFAGDELLDRVPGWLLEKTRDRRQVATDVARLLWIRELHEQGWPRVVWLDADVLVVRPAALTEALEALRGHLLGRETWVQRDEGGRLRARRGVHNALCAFAAGDALLPFYLEVAQRLVRRHEGPMVPQLVGPKLLTALDNVVGLQASWAVNMASPLVLSDLAGGGGPALERWLGRSAEPPVALNLCRSYAGRSEDGVAVDAALLEAAIDRLETAPELLAPAAAARA